jgi:hypothetical protein
LKCISLFHLLYRFISKGIQHLHLFIPAILHFMANSAVAMLCMAMCKRINAALHYFLAILISFSTACMEFAHGALAFAESLLTQKKLYRRERGDVPQSLSLADSLKRVAAGCEMRYALASSDVLNSEILANARLPGVRCAVTKLLSTSDEDRRDGFLHHLFLADLIFVADPLQCRPGAIGQFSQMFI